MPKRLAVKTLNASTIDILNVIRQNASTEYRDRIPKITDVKEIPKVGEVIYGHPAFANECLNALINRIALVRLSSSIFNNPYNILKKGYLEYGETVEEVFTAIANVYIYLADEADKRELKRYLPDVQTAFHAINWRVVYPITVQDAELQRAFLSNEGVQQLIFDIIDQVYQAAEYDEFLLFKYLIIKSVCRSEIMSMDIDGRLLEDVAVDIRGLSNMFTFKSRDYNEARVLTNTPKTRQVVFMDSMFNARYDVEVLSAAFNMDKAEFMGRLFLVDSFTTFDNERFAVIRKESDTLEEVTQAELDMMKNVKAVLLDENWFQVYDNLNRIKSVDVASGLYYTYFYHVQKTISHSPFANAVALVTADVVIPDTITFTVSSVDVADVGVTATLNIDETMGTLSDYNYVFEQNKECIDAGIAVQKYGGLLASTKSAEIPVPLTIVTNSGTYVSTPVTLATIDVGDEIVFALEK